MKIKSNKVNNKNKKLNKKIDTIYVNTRSVFCYDIDSNTERTPNVKNIIITNKVLDYKTSHIEIYDSSANNLYIDGLNNFGGITIPINLFLQKLINIEIVNNNKIKSNFKKINIINNNDILLIIDLDENMSCINIREDFDQLQIFLRSNKSIVEYFISANGKYNKCLRKYYISNEDLDTNGNLDIRHLLKYESLSCEIKNINTLIIDKNIFNDVSKLKEFGIFDKKLCNKIIKNIRIIDDNDMKLIPFDKTFEFEEVVINNGSKNYLYIKTKDDEVVLYLDKCKKLKFISRNEMLKEPIIKNVYFRFREETFGDGGIHESLSFVIKEYEDGKLKVFNLFSKEIEINNQFMDNIILKENEIAKMPPNDREYIYKKDYLGFFNSTDFSDRLLDKLLLINSKYETIKNKAESNGLNSYAIRYLEYRGLLEKLNEIKLSKLEINTFNQLGEKYIKTLKK